MEDWTIRLAQESDLNRLVELQTALQEYIEECNPHIWHLSSEGKERVRDQIAQLLSNSEVRVVVAVNGNGAIIGVVVGSIRYQDNHVPNVSAYIDTLFIEESCRRHGVGTRLIIALCKFFASHNIEDISVCYVVGNHLAEQFWKRLGFQLRIVTAGAKRRDMEGKVAKIRGGHIA